jgi:hypothetical protein
MVLYQIEKPPPKDSLSKSAACAVRLGIDVDTTYKRCDMSSASPPSGDRPGPRRSYVWTKGMAVVTAAAAIGIAGVGAASATAETQPQPARCVVGSFPGDSSPDELKRVAKLASDLAHLEALHSTADSASPAHVRLHESTDAISAELRSLTC